MYTPYLQTILWFLAAFALSMLGGTYWLGRLRRADVLDIPGERSNHVQPTPRGGGVAIVLTVIVLSMFIHVPMGVLAGAFALMMVGWADDRMGLNAVVRLAAQFLMAAAAMTAFPDEMFGGYLNEYYAVLLTLALWVWFINAFNFMDGIDGLASTETVMVSLGVVVVTILAGVPSPLGEFSAIVAGASAAFLVWNWHPAKVFLGDAGSVPLGLLVGYSLIELAQAGVWEPAVILRAENVLDEAVVTRNQAGSIDLGTPRTLWIGLRIAQ